MSLPIHGVEVEFKALSHLKVIAEHIIQNFMI